MAELYFPPSPSEGATVDQNGVTYTWSGQYWSATVDGPGPGDDYWKREGTDLSPVNSGDSLTDVGSITAANYNLEALSPLPA